jgi:hypothetical protein
MELGYPVIKIERPKSYCNTLRSIKKTSLSARTEYKEIQMNATHILARFALLGLLAAALALVVALPALAKEPLAEEPALLPIPDSAPWGSGECQADETGGRSAEWECVGTPLPQPWPSGW